MKLSKYARYLVLLTGLSLAFAAQAEDIDLYAGGQNVTGIKANVLIVLDNSANWNASNQGWPGGVKQGQSELQALSNVLGAVNNNGSVNVGLMMFAKKEGADPNGGYVRFALRDISVTGNLGALKNILDGMKVDGVFNDFQVPTSSAQYGDVMHEAYRYFSGKAPIAGGGNAWRDYPGNGSDSVYPFTAGSLPNNAQASSSASAVYSSPLSANSPCAKNYIIFIGNGFPSNSSPTPNDSSFTNFNFNEIYDEGSKTTWADEWARYLHDVGAANPPSITDAGGTITADGKITTFTIDVYKDQQDFDQTKLLKSMANVGGGEYYAATSEAAIETAIGNIFNQIQAVNSVFTSASLPISVNTQGTYLNQVYMGVFRPDGGGRPRWLGNLKHYKFGLSTDVAGNDSIFLADQNGLSAVNALTGFIKTDARSFWSSSAYPNPGFWAYKPSGVGGQYDAPDGDLVEKGAVAQKLRTLDPRSAATANTRKVYTCWPACSVNTEPDLFSTTNTALVTELTGTDKTINTLTRTDNTVTVTTSTAHALSAGNVVTISGNSVAAYNSSWTVVGVPSSTTTFTFSVSSTPAITATPTTGITVSGGASTTQTNASLSFDAATSYANVFLASHGFVTGQTVVVSGAPISAAMSTADIKCTGRNQTPAVDSPCEYNGTFQITVIDTSNFKYLMPSTNLGAAQVVAVPNDPPLSATGNLVANCRTTGNSSANVASISGTFSNTDLDGLIKFTFTRNGIDGDCIKNNDAGLPYLNSFDVSNTGNAKLNGSYSNGNFTKSCAGTSPSSICTLTFQVNQSKVTDTIAPSNQTGSVTGIPTRSVASITRVGNVATLTTAANHGFTSPSSVTVVGANQAEYNGVKLSTDQTLRAPSNNTLTYTVTVGPTTPATGGTVAAGTGVNANALIEWIRGVDNKEDENQNESLTDVRASIHGDVLHSRPLVVNYGPRSGSTSDVIMAFYGANDGLFRAVLAGDNVANGVEKWSFVANEHYDTLGRLYNNSPLIQFPTITTSVSPTPTKRNYFFDGNIGVYQTPDRATTHLFITARRGGRFIYALDVSDPFTPKFLWKKSNTDTGFDELGYTFSEPKVVPIKKTAGVACKLSDSNTYTRVLIMGAGYDPSVDDSTSSGARTPTMGKGVFVMNPETGALIKLLQPKDSSIKFSVAADVTLLDSNSDGCVDRIYAADTGANIYRYDLTPYDGDAAALANWKTYKVAALGDTGRDGGSDDRRFLFATDAVHFPGPPEYTFLMVGSGNREQPLASNINDLFVVIKDTIQVGDSDSGFGLPSVKYLGDLTRKSQFDLASGGALNLFDSSRKGYYIELENGEKTVNAALTVAGVTYFGTNKPNSPSPYACTSNLGIARGYAINFAIGTAVADRNADGTVNRNDLYTTFTGGGLPPSPVTGVVEVDGKYIRFVIGGGGLGAAGSTIEGVRVQASPASTRSPAYWYFNKD